ISGRLASIEALQPEVSMEAGTADLLARLNAIGAGKQEIGARPQTRWRRFLRSRHAPLLTHASLLACLATMFALLLWAPLWLALVPCLLLEHRVGILIHEYVHGIPFRRRRQNLIVIGLVDGATLSFGMLELFRASHLAHHRWLNTERDPAW